MTSCDKQVINLNLFFFNVWKSEHKGNSLRKPILIFPVNSIKKERESMCCRHKKLQVYFIS